MSGIFSVLSDSKTGMFKLQQAKKAWERDMEAMDAKDAKTLLSEKADKAQRSFALSPQQLRDHASALNAMEEAKRIGSPKAAAEQRLQEIERKIEQLKLMMRYAHGDREKLAQLAREAAILARQAGRAAKEYGSGIAAQAEAGQAGTGSLTGAATERTTTLTIAQTELSVEITVTLGDRRDGAAAAVPPVSAAAAEPMPAEAMPAEAIPAEAMPAEDMMDAPADAPAGDGSALPAEFAELVNAALAGLQATGQPMLGNGRGSKARELMQRMLAENELKVARYKEADAFGRRVEGVLATAKSIIGEAKAANMLEESEERRKARRKVFEAYDKMLEESQQEVNDLRRAAFGSSVSVEDVFHAAAEAGGAEMGGTETGWGDATGEDGSGAAAAVTAGPALPVVQTAVNLLA